MLFLSFYPRRPSIWKNTLFSSVVLLACVWRFSGPGSIPCSGEMLPWKALPLFLCFPFMAVHPWFCLYNKSWKNFRHSCAAPFILPDFTWQNLPAVLSCRLFTCAPGTIPECPISTKESSVWTISRSGFSLDCFSKKYLQNLLEKSFQVVYDRSKRFCVTTHRRSFLKEFLWTVTLYPKTTHS